MTKTRIDRSTVLILCSYYCTHTTVLIHDQDEDRQEQLSDYVDNAITGFVKVAMVIAPTMHTILIARTMHTR
jgi:hypothetical protein